MAFLGRIFGGIIGGAAIKWLAAAGIAAAIAGTAFALIEYGIHLRAAKVKDQINEMVKENRDRNFTVDRKTIDRDAALTLRLQEIDQKWSGKEQLP